MPGDVECSRSSMQLVRPFFLMFCITLCSVNSLPEGLPTITTVADLAQNPGKFDGRLVQVRAWLAFGWEGDDFLFDSMEPEPHGMHSHRPPSLWFYCKPDREKQVWDKMSFGGPPVQGTFTGYFHFAPDQKARMKDVFDPGPLQLEVIGVSDLGTQTKPDRIGPATPHN